MLEPASNLVGLQSKPSTRSTVAIVLECLTYLVSTSVLVFRSNVNTSTWRSLILQPIRVLQCIFMPNLVLWFAVCQFFRARNIRDAVNTAAEKLVAPPDVPASGRLDTAAAATGRRIVGTTNLAWWQRSLGALAHATEAIKHAFRTLTELEPKTDFYPLKFNRDGKSIVCNFERWTLVQGFYADMGGYRFCLPVEEPFQEEQLHPSSVPLKPETIIQLAEASMFEALNIPSHEITETTKAFFWGAIILLARAIYFCATCVKRTHLGRTISLLEVATTAHIFVSLCLQFIWWYKPPYVSRGHILDSQAEQALASLPQELQAQLRGDVKVAYAYTVPKRLGIAMWHRVDDQLITMDQANYRGCLVFFLVGCHAAIHLLPWKICIPSPVGQRLWRASAWYICALAFAVIIPAGLDQGIRELCGKHQGFNKYWLKKDHHGRSHYGNTIWARNSVNRALYVLAPPAVFAVTILFWECAQSFREQPSDLYEAISLL